MFLYFLLSFLWFIRTTKVILFWLYLWQLKEYHLGRFFDHFKTDKGKKLFFNWLFILKIALFFYALILSFYPQLLDWYFYASWIFIIIIFYFFESVKFILDFFKKRTKKPVLTKKTLVLILVNLILIIGVIFFLKIHYLNYFYWFVFWLLVFDIFSPLLISAIVLLFQPLTVLLRNQIIKKAKEKRSYFKNLLVIGITGSYGKTSTKEFLATILSQKYNVLKTKEHQNSEIGISQCILNDLKPEHEIFIVEMGAYNKGGIKLLCDITKPKIGIITGINEQHLATFGTMENLLSAEGGKELIKSLPRSESESSLLWGLPEDGLLILNGNCQLLMSNVKSQMSKLNFKTKFFYCSTKEKADIGAENIRVEKEFVTFTVFSKDGQRTEFRVNLLGAQNVENILLAACCAKELKMDLDEISRACQKLKPMPHQLELKRGLNGLNIIDATYSANLDGVISHLEYLKNWEGKKVIVMPCLIELGEASKEVHKSIGKKMAEVCDPVSEQARYGAGLAIITTRDRFRELKDGFVAGGGKEDNILLMEKPREIFEKIKKFSSKEDVVLLEGRISEKIIKKLI